MNTLFVSMFRHRQVNDLRCIDDKLVPILKELIRTKPYVSFFIGRNGEFDKYAASVIKRTQKEAELKNSDMTLVLPYSVADIEYYEKYYDSVIIPECVHGAHSKAATGRQTGRRCSLHTKGNGPQRKPTCSLLHIP